VPAIPTLEVATRFIPAGTDELVGGDFYDVFAVGDGGWALVVGDVCGKGPEAAAVTSMARWTLRTLSAESAEPDAVLRSLNDALLRDDLDGRFVTVAYLRVVPDGDAARVAVVCAGHPAPILIPAAGRPVTVDARGSLLGIWPDVLLHGSELELGLGDSIAVFTDGLIDQGPGSRPWSPLERLRRDRPPASAEQLAGVLERHVLSLGEQRRDDVAILAMRFRGNHVGKGD
jgi:serine phosphatase RsbU (regulator of sigma subunit)